MKTIIIATNNLNKVREFKSLFPHQDIEFKSLSDIGYTKEIIENGTSFEENAVIKARQVATELGMTAISDDSGLEVEALGGAPGIYSARYAGGHNDDENNALLLKNLRGKSNRNARYVCAICVCQPDGTYKTVTGTCRGKIIDEARGHNGFGYDPYFYVEEFQRTFAEITLEQKNTISHRAKALRAIQDICYADFSFK